MTAVYEDHGVRFRFPENWHLEQQRSAEGTTISVTSPDTAFWSLTLHERSITPEAAADAALRAMRDEYDTLDATPVAERVGDWPAVGHDINFLCLDLTNSCWIRAFEAPRYTLLVLFQTSDLELERSEPVLRAIAHSLEVLEE
jgi:hypothetical protein